METRIFIIYRKMALRPSPMHHGSRVTTTWRFWVFWVLWSFFLNLIVKPSPYAHGMSFPTWDHGDSCRFDDVIKIKTSFYRDNWPTRHGFTTRKLPYLFHIRICNTIKIERFQDEWRRLLYSWHLLQQWAAETETEAPEKSEEYVSYRAVFLASRSLLGVAQIC